MNIKEIVKDKTVIFTRCFDGSLWYKTECGFEFPVPIYEIGASTFYATDKARLFIRYIRKHIENISQPRE